jgi:uncharacterized protein YkwD
VSRRSLERRIGATVLTLGKLAVVALAVVGVIAIYQPSLLGGAAGVLPAGGSPAANTTATQTEVQAATTQTPGPTTVPGDSKHERVENLIHAKVNDRREANGLKPVEKDDLLRTIARSHSKEMGQQGYFAHESPSGATYEDRYDTYGYNCRVELDGNQYATGSENIWRMSSDTEPSAETIAKEAVTGWMTSDRHRRNMLRPYWDDMGIGVYILDSGGRVKVYATQNFC